MNAYNRYQELRRILDETKLRKHVARKFERAPQEVLDRFQRDIDEIREKIRRVRETAEFKAGMEASRPRLNLSKYQAREIQNLKEAIADLKEAVREHECSGDQDRADWFQRFLDECIIRKEEIYAGDR
jgi:predicted RNase H-like nuclease (RuvC/YqgF family)